MVVSSVEWRRWTVTILLLLHAIALNVNANAAGSHALQSWISSRCGPTSCGTWVYEGHLVDPMSGQTLARVQGLEVVRVLGQTKRNRSRRYWERCGDLKLPATLMAHRESAAATTMLSRKMFVYQDLKKDGNSQSEEKDSILSRIKLRATSPERRIPKSQAINVFDSAVTVACAEKDENSWLIHTEFPNGRTLWTHTSVDVEESPTTQTWGFGTYAKLRNKKQATPSSVEPPPKKNNLQPARSAIVSFGQSQAENQAKFGARETYFYSASRTPSPTVTARPKRFWHRWTKHSAPTVEEENASSDPESCYVRYSRYGEGPVWYGPNRMCQLELTGRRLDGEGSSDLPALLQQTVTEYVPDFFSSSHPIADDDAAAEALQAFRTQPLMGIDEPPGDRLQQICHWGGNVWDRIRRSMSHTALPEPT